MAKSRAQQAAIAINMKKKGKKPKRMKKGGYPKSDPNDFMKRMGYYEAGGLATPPMYGDNTIPGLASTSFTTYNEADQAKLDALEKELEESRESNKYMEEANAQMQADMAKRNTIEQGISSAVEKGAELKESGALEELGNKLGIGLSGTDKFLRTSERATKALQKGNVDKFMRLADKSSKFVDAPKELSLLEKATMDPSQINLNTGMPSVPPGTDPLSLNFSGANELSLTTPKPSPLAMTSSGAGAGSTAMGAGMSKVVGSGAFQGAAKAGDFLTTGIGGASKVGSMINPAMLATLAGEGIKKLSDDDDATTFNTGEVAGSVLSGVGTGAGMGAMLGSAIGGPLAPVTGTVGAIVGGLYGIGKGLATRNKARRLEKRAGDKKEKEIQTLASKRKIEGLKSKEYSGFDFGTNIARYGGPARPSMRLGGGVRLYREGGFKLGPEVFRNGGVKLPGGMMKPIPGSAAVEFKGKSHEEGGIMLDPMTEVEGGETMGPVTMSHGGKGDYFFSEHLKLGGKSFAQRHKELLKYGGTQKHIDELAAMQEKVAGRDPKQIAAKGGPRMYENGGPRPDVIKKMQDKGFIWDANANNGRGAFVRGVDVTKIDRNSTTDNMTARNTFLSDPDTNAAVEKLADNLGVSVDEVLDILEAESMYKSDAVNPTSGATGLIQFMPDSSDVNYKTIGGKQYTMGEIAKMSPVQQLELAEKYFKGVGYKPNSGKPLYLAVAYPQALNTRANEIIIPADTDDPKLKAVLEQNPDWLDAKGNITGASIASYGAPDSNYGAETTSALPKGAVDIGDRVLLDQEAEYYNSLSPEQQEEYKTFARDNRTNNQLFIADEPVVGNVDFDDADLANFSNRKQLVDSYMLSKGANKPEKPKRSMYFSQSRYDKDGSRLKPGKTRKVFEEDLYKSAMAKYNQELALYNNTAAEAKALADSKGFKTGLGRASDFVRQNDLATMAATGLQFIPAAMAYKDTPDYMSNPQDIRRVDLDRVSYNTERAANAADSRAMGKFIETSGMGPAGIIAKMASYRAKQEGDMKIAAQESRVNTDIANREAMMNRQIQSDNIKNDMVVDEFNRAADAATKDRKLEAVNNAVQTIAGINRDRLMRRANDRMALAVEGTTGVLDRFDLRLQASQIAGASSGPEYDAALQQLQMQQNIQLQNNPLLQRLGGIRYGK